MCKRKGPGRLCYSEPENSDTESGLAKKARRRESSWADNPRRFKEFSDILSGNRGVPKTRGRGKIRQDSHLLHADSISKDPIVKIEPEEQNTMEAALEAIRRDRDQADYYPPRVVDSWHADDDDHESYRYRSRSELADERDERSELPESSHEDRHYHRNRHHYRSGRRHRSLDHNRERNRERSRERGGNRETHRRHRESTFDDRSSINHDNRHRHRSQSIGNRSRRARSYRTRSQSPVRAPSVKAETSPNDLDFPSPEFGPGELAELDHGSSPPANNVDGLSRAFPSSSMYLFPGCYDLNEFGKSIIVTGGGRSFETLQTDQGSIQLPLSDIFDFTFRPKKLPTAADAAASASADGSEAGKMPVTLAYYPDYSELADKTCNACGRQGHVLAQCVYTSESGDLNGCPFCNEFESHLPEDCTEYDNDEERIWLLFVVQRMGKSHIKTKSEMLMWPNIVARRHDAHPEEAPLVFYPHSRGFAIKQIQRLPDLCQVHDYNLELRNLAVDDDTTDRDAILKGVELDRLIRAGVKPFGRHKYA